MTDSSKFASSTGRVKPRAFQPPRDSRFISTFCTAELGDHMVWHLADMHLASKAGSQVLAAADLSSAAIRAAKMKFILDDDPVRHGHIGEFPVAKDEWKSIAQQLAALASLRRR